MDKKKVFLITDIHDSLPELESRHRQEWESQTSIDYLIETIASLDYEPILLEPKKSKIKILDTLKSILENSNVENSILFNLVEGFSSRNREGYVPSLAEFFGIAYTGSDAYAQSISLDKNLTKQIASRYGIPTKASYLLESSNALPQTFDYPIFIKPNGEGSSLGIGGANIIRNRKDLELKTQELLSEFDSILLEEFLPGDDLTLGVLGNFPDYKATSVAKIDYPSIVYGEEIKTKESMPETFSFCVSKELELKIQKDSIHICKLLKISGFARLDWKCDKMKNPFFLEMNLTPGLSPFYSALPICYTASFGNYSDLIKKVLQFGYENYNSNKIFNYGRLEKI